MTNSDPESSPTPSHSPKPRMRISILFVCRQPSDVYISIGPLRRLIYYLFVCGQPSNVYISIGPLRRLIYYLFVDYPPMNINWAAPTIDIFNLDYPPIINIFRQPSEPFFSRLISCTHFYSPKVFQCIWNACMPIPIQSNSHVNI